MITIRTNHVSKARCLQYVSGRPEKSGNIHKNDKLFLFLRVVIPDKFYNLKKQPSKMTDLSLPEIASKECGYCLIRIDTNASGAQIETYSDGMYKICRACDKFCHPECGIFDIANVPNPDQPMWVSILDGSTPCCFKCYEDAANPETKRKYFAEIIGHLQARNSDSWKTKFSPADFINDNQTVTADGGVFTPESDDSDESDEHAQDQQNTDSQDEESQEDETETPTELFHIMQIPSV